MMYIINLGQNEDSRMVIKLGERPKDHVNFVCDCVVILNFVLGLNYNNIVIV